MLLMNQTISFHMQFLDEYFITQKEAEITLYPELCQDVLEWDMYVNELEFE
ncbi:MAG: hypothetical protein ACKOBX_02315 [Bacteroidota bacterium]